MVWISLITEAFSALWANRLRSFLTILGMVMGVTSVIAIVSTVEGFQANIEQVFKSLGPKSFIASRFGIALSWEEYLERLKRKTLTRNLIPKIEEGCPDCEEVGAETYNRENIQRNNIRMRRVSIVGKTPNMLSINGRELLMGRYFTEKDDRRNKKVAVIGHLVYTKLFDNEDPIGKKLKLGRNEFTIIGVVETLGESNLIDDVDDFIDIPLATYQQIYHEPGNPGNIISSAVTLERRERAINQVRTVLRTNRRLTYLEEDDFAIITPDAILSFINDITRAFRVLFVSLPLLSIVIGGIVIMNIMMISVTERTREIGIRKAIGAKSKNILVQFLYESIILSLTGGVIGIVLGVKLGNLFLTSVMEIYITPTNLGIILGFGISTCVGLFFGIYPAMKAAKLDPIKALSYE